MLKKIIRFIINFFLFKKKGTTNSTSKIEKEVIHLAELPKRKYNINNNRKRTPGRRFFYWGGIKYSILKVKK